MQLVDRTGLAHPGFEMAAVSLPPRGYRAPRHQAEPMPITASLAGLDLPGSDGLELHAEVMLADGGRVVYSTSNPTQSIFWKHPPAGDYSIAVRSSERCRLDTADLSFRAVLTGESQKPFEVHGFMQEDAVECFRFTVAESGMIRSCRAWSQEAESEETSTKAPSEAEC